MARKPKNVMSEKDAIGEVLKRLIGHDALPACDSRQDLEMIAHMPIPDTIWAKIERWSAEMDCCCGEALWRKNDELDRQHLMRVLKPRMDAIFLDKDGNDRPDADQRLDLAVEMAEAENPEGMAFFRAAIAPWQASLPADAQGKVVEDSLRSFLAGLDSARITKAHVALARIRACPGTPMYQANSR